jgi:glyoxalase family protein
MRALEGLHHVTAITGDARGNVDFYTRVLGMRLVKKTVNQDDVSAYHLFYADAVGSPGTDLTFFDWPQTPPNRPGVPEIAPVALRVASEQALEWWAGRFEGMGIAHGPAAEAGGRLRMPFEDPEGQRLELVVDGGTPGGVPWEGSPVPADAQVRGLHGVTLVSARPQVTAELLTEVLGFRTTSERELPDGGREHGFEVGEGGPGTEVRLALPGGRPGWSSQGRGGVHHVALRVPDDQAQTDWRQRVEATGLRPTPVIDRFYFRSVYFREPGGNLFEIATDGPGFTADQPLDMLGKGLALPPFLEPERQAIEANLVPLDV